MKETEEGLVDGEESFQLTQNLGKEIKYGYAFLYYGLQNLSSLQPLG